MKKNWSKLAGLLSIALLLGFGLAGIQPSPARATVVVCYVDKDATSGLNNGSTWADAYTDLQDALFQVGPVCGVIWVAEGTYKPVPPESLDRAISFVMSDNVALYGGFSGTETVLADRDPDPLNTHPTILSGDIAVPLDASDNSYHVVKTSGNAVLDGFLIMRGNANAALPNNLGGGVNSICGALTGKTLTLANMIIRDNLASFNTGGGGGAGMYVSLCTLTITNSLFDANVVFDSVTTNMAQKGSGGGLFLENTTALSNLTNVDFQDNAASAYGGGIYSESPLELTDVNFNTNFAGYLGLGGGIHTTKSLTLTTVSFTTNTAKRGGGLSTTAVSNLTDVTFSFNSASEHGGGLSITNSAAATLTNVTFNDNSATTPANSFGGGMYAAPSSPSLTDVTFLNNTSGGNGGGLYTQGSPVLTRVTFTSNTAAYGGGWYGLNSAQTGTLTNVIFDGNTASINGGGIHLISNAALTGTSTCKPIITRTTFMNNIAAGKGGGMYNDNATPTLGNVTFRNNSADYGGGIANFNKSNAIITFVTFNTNFVEIEGSGMANYDGPTSPGYPSNPIVRNSIFWGNTVTGHPEITAQIYNNSFDGIHSSSAAVTYSIVQSGYGGTGNKTGDPLFGSFDYYHGAFTKTLPILQGSSAIDNGEVATCAGTDQNGILRPVGAKCDIGAYEAGYTISGNAGIVGATISYFDGTAKTALSNSNGDFSFAVSYGFTGTITPSKTGAIFTPPFISYALSPVTTNLTDQNFIATTVTTHTISGKISPYGGGATVSYTGGSTTANGTGVYSFIVNHGWSGTVTPSKAGYTYTPISRSYSNIIANQTGQNYSGAILGNVNVYIGGVIKGNYVLSTGLSTRQNYASVNNGPVRVASTDATSIITAIRVLFGGVSYSEMMGFPSNQLTTDYWFPYYNNTAMDSQLRVSNVGGSSTTITVTYGNDLPLDNYTLAAGATTRKSYPVNNGPLHVTSSSSNILTTIRVLYGGLSYSELMGFPNNQLATDYWYPYYNNTAMNSQLRVSNVGSSSTTITVTYGNNIPLDSYTLAAGAATRKNYPGINSGPLHVTSSDSNILTTIRVLYADQSYSELSGYPANQLTLSYAYPVYDNVTANSQLRVSNVGGVPTLITVYGANNAVIDSYTLAAGAATRKNYSMNGGPLRVVSTLSNILTTQRLLYTTPSFSSYYELTGFPVNQLTTEYYFPWYNNTAMSSQIRIAVP